MKINIYIYLVMLWEPKFMDGHYGRTHFQEHGWRLGKLKQTNKQREIDF